MDKKMQILRKTGLKAYSQALSLGQKGVIDLIKKKGLIGRGGAGFPASMKWEMVLNEKSDAKYLICNADEGEPGTFKDRFILMNNPEAVIEGILIAAFAISAEQAFIYLRGEYDYLEKDLKKTIKSVTAKTKAGTKIDIVVGAGAYVCGDETAIISSIEGFRGQPRHKPPFPTVKGLFGKPTVINNVETLANVPMAMLFDDWNPDLRLYSLSGNVTKPGVYELPLGTKLCDLIEMGKPKNKIKAIYFGCFGGCLPHCDIELTPQNICGKDCMLGSCTIIAVDDTKSVIDAATNIAKFYEFESCGKCTPCREGTMRILALLEKISMGKGKKEDLVTLEELGEVIRDTSFCGLGQTATHHLLTAMKYFRKEFEDKVK
ncbi:MAG: SLBB domain-containing protein [Nanoarchaeota archaeon]|nr:SLBB domain-containing protein [Nanoarchaeota archaeon]